MRKFYEVFISAVVAFGFVSCVSLISSLAAQSAAFDVFKASPSQAGFLKQEAYLSENSIEDNMGAVTRAQANDENIIVKIRYKNLNGNTVEEQKNSMSFYLVRDKNTNEVLKRPEPVHVTLQLKAGVNPVTDLQIDVSPELKEKIDLRYGENKTLTDRSPVEFDVSFWDDDLAKGRIPSLNGMIKVISGGVPIKEISVFCGADGLYSFYNSEFPQTFTGEPVGRTYVSVGTVSLNAFSSPTFTIHHMWRPMQGAESAALKTIELNPDGEFEFLDGSYRQNAVLEDSGYMQFKIHMKDSVFQKLRNEALSGEKYIKKYIPLIDLLFKYEGASGDDDGYWVGGKGSTLPLVYLLRYNPHGGNGSSGSGSGSGSGGGSGGGSGSGSGGGSGGGSASVTVDTTNYNVAKGGDAGWEYLDGFWYYLNSKNQKVTGWLQLANSKWYYFDKDGKMIKGWVLVDNFWYFMGEDGSMITGWLQTPDYKWYYLRQNGSMATGWVQNTDGNWYYLIADGAMAVNSTTPDGYYVNADGVFVP